MNLAPPERFIVEIGCVSKIQFLNLGNWSVGLLKLMGMDNESSLLDLGCGPGRVAITLGKEHIGRYVGVDLNEEYIKWCQENVPNRGFIKVDGDGNEPLPFEDDSFDYIIAHSILTHTDEKLTKFYLDEIKRLMRKSALLTVFQSDKQEYCKAGNSPNNNKYYYSKAWIDREFDKRGFRRTFLKGNWHDGYGFWSQDIYVLKKGSQS